MDERIHTRMEYFTVVRPQSVTAKGLFSVLETGLKHLDITEKLVGISTDGASTNIMASRLKGLNVGRTFGLGVLYVVYGIWS